MSDPKYVRLADHLSRGMRADLNSGFSIAGLNVLPMPDKEETPGQYEFVKTELRAGRLEGASKAEYDEVHPDVLKNLGVKVERPTMTVEAQPVQEHQVQREARKANRKIRSSRLSGDAAEAALEADEERRAAAVKAQGKGKESRAARRQAAEAAAAEEEARQAALAEGEDDSDEDDESEDESGQQG